MNKLKTGDIIPFGEYDWRVLDVQEDRALIITENVVEQRPYNTKNTGVTWETCDLRKYLNDEFLSKLDSPRIVLTHNQNPDNPWYDGDGGSNTKDNVFLLSLDEVVKYFGDSGDLKNRKGWECYKDGKALLKDGNGWLLNDQYNNSRVACGINNEACLWWLRSPGVNDTAVMVLEDGFIYVCGFIVNDSYGVRPALWLNLCGGN